MKSPAPLTLTPAEYGYVHYFFVAPPGVDFEQVQKPDFWVHVVKTFRLHDVIEIVAADGSFEADLRVTSVSTLSGTVRFRVLRHFIGEVTAVPVMEKEPLFILKHKGFGRWTIVEKKTGRIVADGLSREEADKQVATSTAERIAA